MADGRNRARQRAIRARMAATGESYTAAMRANDAEQAAKKAAAGPVNVKDFGAVGDGVTDDTAAFQAAVDSLPAK